MAECGGGFIAGRHHMTVANRVFSGGSWRPLSASRDVTVDRKRRKSARGVTAHAEARRALRAWRRGERCVCGEHCVCDSHRSAENGGAAAGEGGWR